MNKQLNNSYNYQGKTYSINPFQSKMYSDIKSLGDTLYYVVGKQNSNSKGGNLNLKQLKNFIRRGLRRYFQRYSPIYYQGQENELVKFYCVFETNKEFNQSQKEKVLFDDGFYIGLHFHLFISIPKTFDWFSFGLLFNSICSELTSLSYRRDCFSHLDCDKIIDLDEVFILYHTKQFFDRPTSEMIMKNN
jgi:hypothetical protein